MVQFLHLILPVVAMELRGVGQRNSRDWRLRYAFTLTITITNLKRAVMPV